MSAEPLELDEPPRECFECFRLCGECDVLWGRQPHNLRERAWLVWSELSGLLWWYRHNGPLWWTCATCRAGRQDSATREQL